MFIAKIISEFQVSIKLTFVAAQAALCQKLVRGPEEKFMIFHIQSILSKQPLKRRQKIDFQDW